MDDGVSGCLAAEGDNATLAARPLTDNAGRFLRTGAAARAAVEEKFGLGWRTAVLQGCYGEAVALSPRRGAAAHCPPPDDSVRRHFFPHDF